jgi:PhzF family phenazine biosynthesis protein
MKLSIYQVDAFADKLFSGNPAAVVPLKEWLPDETLQKIAMENNLAETAFFLPSKEKGADFELRWFTPEVEINLCGHATLASAYVIFHLLKAKKKQVSFSSKSGLLHVARKGEMIELDFPSWKPEKLNDYPAGLSQALGVEKIAGVYRHRDLLVEVSSQQEVEDASPDFAAIKKIADKVIITAPGHDFDFVSRFFAPGVGVDEDPVTGSAHSQLIPFWSERLNKTKMTAKQLSKRGGILHVEQNGERVKMGGYCVFYMEGKIRL